MKKTEDDLMTIYYKCDHCGTILSKDNIIHGQFRKKTESCKSGFKAVSKDICIPCYTEIFGEYRLNGDFKEMI